MAVTMVMTRIIVRVLILVIYNGDSNARDNNGNSYRIVNGKNTKRL